MDYSWGRLAFVTLLLEELAPLAHYRMSEFAELTFGGQRPSTVTLARALLNALEVLTGIGVDLARDTRIQDCRARLHQYL